MGTTAAQFFPSNTDQDQAYGASGGAGTVYKLEDTTAAVVSTTRAMHPNTAGTTIITLDPYSDRATTGDVTADYGWGINQSGADGMESGVHAHASSPSLTGLRVIPAGDWSFFQRITIPIGGTLTGSHNVIVAWKVYRVATGGGTRTLLFTVTAPEQSGGAISVTQTDTGVITSSQPEIVLQSGETIHVGIQSTNRQVAGTLSAVTAGTIVYHTGGAADSYVQVPTGIRSRYSPSISPEDATTDATLDRLLKQLRNMPETVQGTDLTTPVQRAIKTGRGLSESVPTADAIDRKYHSFRANSESIPIGADTPLRKFVGFRAPAAESIPVTSTLSLSFKGERATTESIPTTDSAARFFKGTRTVSESLTTSDALARIYKAVRALSESIPTTDSVGRLYKGGRVISESYPTVDAIARAVKQRRFLDEYPTGVNPDFAVTFPTKKIAGLVKTSTGDPIEGATVKLFRAQDDKMVQETTSAVDGSYEFLRDEFDPYIYFVVAYEEVGTPTQGLTIRNLSPVSV
jgi:hypothetical protein